MGKLYSKEPAALAVEQVVDGDLPGEDITTLMSDAEGALEMASEASEMALERLICTEAMQGHMESQKLCSVPYMNSLESYSPLVKALGARLGVKHLPSLEDYKNPYAAQDAHGFAMEGFKEMVSKAWEKLKAFFKDFFKKIVLFFKRLAKANLDLESYERYCEKLVAKLSANKATLSDNTPMQSALPSLLAGKGDGVVDSDYIRNQGGIKINNLITKVNDLSMQGGGALLYEGLASYRKVLKTFVDINANTPQDEASFMEAANALRATGYGMIAKLFAYEVKNPRDIPSQAFESLMQHYQGKDIKDPGFEIWSVADSYDPYRELPRGVNMFLTHVKQTNLFVCSAKEQGNTASKTLVPIGRVENLVEFHKGYKSTLGSFNYAGIDKNTDAVAGEIDKILTFMQRDFAALMQDNKPLSKSYTPEFMMEMFKRTIAVRGEEGEEDIYAVFGDVFHAMRRDGFTPEVVASFAERISACYSSQVGGNTTPANALFELKAVLPEVRKYLNLFIDSYLLHHKSILGTVQNEEGVVSRAQTLRELNNFLTSLFMRLQSLYKNLASDFYGVLTELRYAVIKYIYDSAKRYSY